MKSLLQRLTFAVAFLGVCASPRAAMLGNIDSVLKLSATEVTLKCGTAAVRIKAWDDDVVRIWMDTTGSFNYYTSYNSYMTIPANFPGPASCTISDNATDVRIATSKVLLVIKKAPFQMSIYKPDGTTLITRNPAGNTFGTDNKAYLERDAAGTTEHFFGLGGNDFTSCDKRGRSRTCYDSLMYGAPSPFFMSTAGYGFFLQNDNGAACSFNFTASPVVIGAAKGPMDLFFFYGPSFKTMIGQYTRLTGTPFMVPKKTMGLTYHVSVGFDNTCGDIPLFRSGNYPVDNCITFIKRAYAASDQLVKDTCAKLHGTNVSVFGYVNKLNSGLQLDTTAPFDSWATMQSNITSRLFAQGVNTIFADELETMGESYQFKFMEAVAQAFSQYAPTLRTLVLNRAGYAACQRFGYWWMGDMATHVQSAKKVVCCQLNCGLGGFPLTTHDMAGYLVGSPGTANSLIRGCQMNFIQPISQMNSYRGNPEPWNWSVDAQTIFMKFDQLHYRLLPYWYTLLWQAHTTGMPGWRHLVLDNQDDATVYAVDDEMMVGDCFLFAPITDEGIARSIYFPKGAWYNYFTGERIDGPKTVASYSVPFDQAALFAKAGAIIPSGPDVQYVDEKPLNPLMLEVYPSTNSSFTLYEDDGVTRQYETANAFCTTTYTCTADNTNIQLRCGATACQNSAAYAPSYPRSVVSVFKNIVAKPPQVLGNSITLPEAASATALTAASQGWFYDGSAKTVSVKYASGGAEMLISFANNGSVPVVNERPDTRQPLAFHSKPLCGGALILEYFLSRPASAEFTVFSCNGRILGRRMPGIEAAGPHSVTFESLAPGMVIVQCKFEGREMLSRARIMK